MRVHPGSVEHESATAGDAPTSTWWGIAIVALAIGLFGLLDLAVGLAQPAESSLDDRLPVAMERGDVYLLGNSMFKTGVDLDQLSGILPDESVKFSYHDGYYSNLWYLMAKNAIVPRPDDLPKVLVWGFRPTYANQPAFQKIDSPDIDTFSLESEPFWDEAVSSQGLTVIPDRTLASRLADHSTIRSERARAQDWTQSAANRISVSLLDAVGAGSADALRSALIDSDDSVSDVLLRAVTDGRVQMSEELVVDAGAQFIEGPEVQFDQSFIPPTTELLSEAGIDQLVVIFKPVSVLDETIPPSAVEFADAASRFFEEQGIPYLNLLDEESLSSDQFASGDHYNADGRENVTALVGNRLRLLLGQGAATPSQAG